MNEIIENIITRRSIRKYKDTPVEREKIEQIIKCGEYAPSGMGQQPWKFLVVEDKEVMEWLRKENKIALGFGPDKEVDPFYGAPVVIVVLADNTCSTYREDGSLALENMMLAAHSLGLGSCWIHRAWQTFETEEGKALLKKLGIGENYSGVGNMILGYPDCELPVAKPRKTDMTYYI